MQTQKLPNATAVLILGIASIITCCCYGIVGLIAGGVGLMMAKKDLKLYNENPELYSNYSNLKIGRVLCIIGIILSVVYILFLIWGISTFGMDTMSDQELLQQRMNEYFGR